MAEWIEIELSEYLSVTDQHPSFLLITSHYISFIISFLIVCD